MTKFKIGDKVICIEPRNDTKFQLPENVIVTITDIRRGQFIVLKEFTNGYGHSQTRFKMAKKRTTLSKYLTT